MGDSDLAAGVFFAEFGRTVVFGNQQTKGNLDAPAKDGVFGSAKVEDVEYRLEIAAVAFNPFPAAGDVLTVDGTAYRVRSAEPMDDGQVVTLYLRRL